MDPHAERWPAATEVINETYGRLLDVCKELEILRAEKAIAAWTEKRDFMDDLRFNLGMPMDRVSRRRCVQRFTQVMLEKGAQIYERLEDGGTFPD
tara:strand:- start:299 stop:583 length:285 start_codon:yes stop_codon:yes gene_type:complete